MDAEPVAARVDELAPAGVPDAAGVELAPDSPKA